MPVMTHDSKWRLLVGAAPLVGVAFLVWAAAQGEAEVAQSPTVRGVLAVVAALGAGVAWWTSRQLRAAPTVPVAQAIALAQAGQLPGVVAMHGRAQALPESPPLVSPGGELCLWFKYGEQFVHPYSANDSVRPFLLVDDSGRCIVLPAGADVTGNGRASSPPMRLDLAGQTDIDGTGDLRSSERLLRVGDRIHVVGRFVAASPEALDLQTRAAALVVRTESVQAIERSGDAAVPMFSIPPPPARPSLALPVLADPGGTQPFVIHMGSDEGEGGLYGLLAVVDLLVLIVAGGLVVWSLVGQH